MRLQFFVKCFVGQQARLACVEHGELRVEAEFVEMFAHELEAKAVQRADVRGVEERELFGQAFGRGLRSSASFSSIARRRRCFISAAAASVKVTTRISSSDGAFPTKAIEAALDERVRLAGARAGHDQHVAARGDGLPLRWRERIVLVCGGFHLAEILATDGTDETRICCAVICVRNRDNFCTQLG